MIVIIGIDYNEGDQTSYRGVKVSTDKSTKTFYTGNIEYDFMEARVYCDDIKADVYLSSSCDNFIMDGNRYCWEYTNFGSIIKNCN